MPNVIFKAKARQFQNGCLLLPATEKDKQLLNSFCETLGNRYATVTANFAKNNKSYDQVKTVWALCTLLYQINYDRVPTETERNRMYESLLDDFAPKEPDLLHPEKERPIHLSRMSKMEAAQFINAIFNLIIENCDLTDKQQVSVRELFTEFKRETSIGVGNPCDYDAEGNLLSIDEWCERNNVSMASGVNDGTLEIAHIITKSKRPDIRDCVWNFLRLTHYEHLEIQHRKGWKELLSIYPHLIPRVKAAYDMAHELYPFTMTEEFNALEEEQKEEVKEGPGFNNMEPVAEKNSEAEPLAVQALKAAGLVDEDAPYEGDIF